MLSFVKNNCNLKFARILIHHKQYVSILEIARLSSDASRNRNVDLICGLSVSDGLPAKTSFLATAKSELL